MLCFRNNRHDHCKNTLLISYWDCTNCNSFRSGSASSIKKISAVSWNSSNSGHCTPAPSAFSPRGHQLLLTCLSKMSSELKGTAFITAQRHEKLPESDGPSDSITKFLAIQRANPEKLTDKDIHVSIVQILRRVRIRRELLSVRSCIACTRIPRR
jgi:hypothetical protein